MSSVQDLEYDNDTVWHHNVQQRTYMELHRFHLMRHGFLNGFQEALDILKKQNEPYKDIATPMYDHVLRIHDMMKSYKEDLVELHFKLNKEFDEDMKECVGIAMERGLKSEAMEAMKEVLKSNE